MHHNAFSIAWLLSLPLVWMLLLFFLFFSLIQGLIAFATNIVTLPYAWIVKGNGVALGVSILHFIISLIMCAVGMWRANPEGFWQVTAIIILNVLLVETAVWVINALFNIYYRL